MKKIDWSKAERGKFFGKNLRIEFAEDAKVKQYQADIDKLLGIMGFDWALVTDLSSIGDFLTEENDVQEIGKKLGFEISRRDYMYEVAMRMGKSN
jgi:hypothetical protein